jgi:hypothetical protein
MRSTPTSPLRISTTWRLCGQAGYLRSLESANARLSVDVTQLRERHGSIEASWMGKRGLDENLSTMT